MQRKVVNLTVLKKEEPNAVQQQNIRAVASLASMIKSSLGPRSMLKMVLTRIGTIELTNDGNSILREMEVVHPAIRTIVDLARTQSEEVGDGTTSVILLAVELLAEMGPLLSEGFHPVPIGDALRKCMEHVLKELKARSISIQTAKKFLQKEKDTEENVIKHIIGAAVETKICKEYKIEIDSMALEAVKRVRTGEGRTFKEDLKHFVKIEKIPGGHVEESQIIDGIIINKEVLSHDTRRRIENPKIVLLDFPIEYRKGARKMNLEVVDDSAFYNTLLMEEEEIKRICNEIMKHGPDIVITEKGMCDNAVSCFAIRGITTIRRVKKTDNERIARAVGARIVSRAEDVSSGTIGGECGLFECTKIGEEYFSMFLKCKNPRACSIVLRGPSRDVLDEIERNLHDALGIARNLTIYPHVVTGGGSIEMHLSNSVSKMAPTNEMERRVFRGVAEALKIIPYTLVCNSGCTNPVRRMTELESKNKADPRAGVDGETGEIADMSNKVLESVLVKDQCLKSAFECATILLRVDGIVSST